MSNQQPVTFAVVGVGGFGQWILEALRKLEKAGRVKLIGACEPAQEQNAARITELKQQGITVVSDFADVLKMPVQAIWMPVPIHLHRPFTEAALAAGKWVICEKPAAGSIQDIDAMIVARDRHDGKVVIAFQDIHEASTPLLKRRLLDGAIGKIQQVSVVGLMPRPARYYARNNWAGQLRRGETWLLDSPCTNAMAHYVNLPLFLLGPDMRSSATPISVEAELYRTRSIPSADTTCIRLQTANGVGVLLLMAHACDADYGPHMVLHGDKGTMHLNGRSAEIIPHGGPSEVIPRAAYHGRTAEVALDHWVDGRTDAPLAELEVAYRQTQAANGAFDASPIHSIAPEHVQTAGEGADLQPYLPGIKEFFIECATRGQLPHETGKARWSRPAGKLDLQGYRTFQGTFCR